MKTLLVTINGNHLCAAMCVTDAQMDLLIAEEMATFSISHKWDEVQQIRDTPHASRLSGFDCDVDPRFPSYDVDDALMMWPGFRPF